MTFLESFAKNNESKIKDWIASKISHSDHPLLYTSCDVRYAGFKITQVDSNCFPAGFNNLKEEDKKKAAELYKTFFQESGVTSVLIYPEFHTRNLGYLDNLLTLKSVFEIAGVEVKIVSNQKNNTKIKFISPSDGAEKVIYYETFKKCIDKSDLIILNNDLSKEMPIILKDLTKKILPSPYMGWWHRKKTDHFKHYSDVVSDFAKDFDVDPWLFDSYFDEISDVDFKTDISQSLLEEKIYNLKEKISIKYKEYNIKKEPVIFIKPNRGTYGMGVHVIKSMEDGLQFNKNVRKKMDVIKDGVKNTDLIIQEGVETVLLKDDKAVEPVVYSVLSRQVGMFFRINAGSMANLNSRDMELSNLYKITEEQEILANLISSFANLATLMEINCLPNL